MKKYSDLHSCLMKDALSMGVLRGSYFSRLKTYCTNPRWRFIVLLRRYEYFASKYNSILFKAYSKVLYFQYKRLGLQLGFSIPPFVCGPGLSLPHYGTIVISKQSIIGSNCRIHVDVNIGASGGSKEAPKIGNNVYIGPGAKLFGDIKIANGISVGANAVVNKSFEEENTVIGGVPAKVLKRESPFWWKTNRINLE